MAFSLFSYFSKRWLERDGALLRAGDALFGDEKNIIRLGQHGRAVLFRDVKDIVLVRDQMRADRQHRQEEPFYVYMVQ